MLFNASKCLDIGGGQSLPLNTNLSRIGNAGWGLSCVSYGRFPTMCDPYKSYV